MTKFFTFSMILCLWLVSNGASAQVTYYSQKSGLWNEPAMWNTAANGTGFAMLDPNLPTNTIIIQAGHQVVLNKSRAVQNITIQPTASLTNGIATKRRLILHGTLTCNGTMGNGNTPDSISIEVEGASCTIGGAGNIDVLSIKKQDAVNATTNLTVDANVVLHDVGGVLSNSKKNTNFNVTLNQGKMITALGNPLGSPAVAADVCIDGGDGTNGDERGGTFNINGTLVVHGKLYLTTDNALPAYACTFKIGSTGVVEVKDEMTCDSSNLAGHTLTMLPNAQLILSGAGNVIDNFSKMNNVYTIDAAATIEFRNATAQSIEDDLSYPKVLMTGSGSIKTLKGNLNHRGIMEIMPNVLVTSPNEKADIKMQANIINNGTIGTATDSVGIDAACATCSITGNGSFNLRKIVKKGDINPTTNLILDANITLKETNATLYNDKANTLFNITINPNKTLTLTQGNAGIDIAEALPTAYIPRERGGKWLVQGTMIVGGTLYLTTDNLLPAYNCNIEVASGGTLQTNHIVATASSAAVHIFTLKSGGTLDIKGSFAAASMANNQYNIDANSHIIYSGSAPQTINAQINYGHLTLKNAIKTLPDNLITIGNININSGAKLDLITYTLTTQGNIVDANATTSGLAAAQGKIIWSGITTQTINANNAATILGNVEINNASGIYFSNDVVFNNNIKFVQGSITHATTATPTLAPTATSTNDAPTRTIQGTTNIQTATTTTMRTPLWSASGINIVLTPRTAMPTTFALQIVNAAAPAAAASNIIKRTSTTEYLTITRTAGTAQTKVDFAWNTPYTGISNINDIAKMELAHLQNNTWNPASTPTQRTGTMQAGTLGTDYLNAFGTFAIGANVGILPVTWLYVNAKQHDQAVVLQWKTANETNNSHFEIQRKTAQNPEYQTINTTQGSGTTTLPQTYVYTDHQPIGNTNITQKQQRTYRIIQIDYDGRATHSPEVSLYFVPNNNGYLRTATIYKTPQTIDITVQNNSEPLQYYLINMQGETIDAATIYDNNIQIHTDNLPHGVYLLKLTTATEIFFIQKILH